MMKYLKFSEEGDDEVLTAQAALMKWVTSQTAGYAGVTITKTFTSTFKDGLALCAIIHKHRPDLVNFASLTVGNSAVNIQTAFDAANKCFGLETDVLTISEYGELDDKGMLVYVAEYYQG